MFGRIAFFTLLVLIVPCIARAAAHVELTTSATTIVMRNGAPVALPMPGTLTPGTRIRYTIVAKNTGDRPAAQLAPSAKIPAGERFVAGSAGARATFSVDGGKTFVAQPMVTVANPGGTTTQRPALPAEITAIRWLDPMPLAPGARATFVYEIIVE